MGTTGENVAGTAKEAVGEAINDEDLEHEGEQQQKKAQKEEEAQELQEAANEKEQEATGHKGAEKAADGT